MSKLRQLIEAANRKCEMAWKVYSYNPEKDNELVDTSKAFDCIAAAQAHKREILEKNPNYTVEIVAESAQKNEDFYKYIDDVPTREIAKALKELGIKEPYATQKAKIANLLAKRFGLRSVPTPIEMTSVLDALPYFKEEAANIDAKNPGILEVPDGKKVDELPQSHFEKLVDKKGYAEVIRALTNLEVWNKDKNKSLSLWASNMADKLKKKFRPESAQKNEDLSKHPKLQEVWSRWKFNTKYGLHYTSNAKDTQAYLAKITKPNTFWLEDEDTGKAIVQGTPKDLINFMLSHKDMVENSSQKSESKVNMSKLKNEIQAAVNKYFKDDKDLLEYVHIDTKKDKLGRDILEVRAELGYNDMVKLADHLDKIVTKYDRYAYFDQETSGIMTAVFESTQKNEDTRQWHKLSDITKDDKPFIVIGKKDSSNGYYINVVSILYDLTNFSNGIWFDLDDKAFNTKEQAYDRAKKSYPKAKVIFANKKDFSNTRLSKYANESTQKNESLRDLNLELADDTNAIAASADKIRQRFEYRTLQNQSYDEKQAEKIYLEVRRELEKAKKMIDACYNKIG